MHKIFSRDPICSKLNEAERTKLEDSRRAFIAEHDIVSENSNASYLCTLRNIGGHGRLDHLRLYKSWFGEVTLVCSNYDCNPPAILGMQPIDQIYHPGATSYARKFNNSQTLRGFISALSTLSNYGELERINQLINAKR